MSCITVQHHLGYFLAALKQDMYLATIIFVLQHIFNVKASNFWYVVTEGQKCPQVGKNVLCRTLENFTAYTNSIANNTEVVFSPGTHYLNSDFNIHNKINISLRGADNTATIQCTHHQPVSLHIERSSLISISNITINGCGRHGINNTDNFAVFPSFISFEKCTLSKIEKSHTYAAIFFDYVKNISISHVTVSNTSGYGVYMYNCLGHILVQRSFIKSNKGGNAYNGGNIRVVLSKNCSRNPPGTSLLISESSIMDGKSNSFFESHTAISASGIHICSFCPTASIHINKSNISGNDGGNVYIFMMNYVAHYWRVVIENTTITDGNAYEGAGIHFASRLQIHDYKKCNHTPINENFFKMYGLTFSNNSAKYSGGAMKIQLAESDCKPSTIYFKNCTFTNNSISSHFSPGSALRVMKHQVPKFKLSRLSRQKIYFNKVIFQKHLKNSKWYDSTVKVENFDNLKFKDCSFLDNKGTALALKTSDVIFSGLIVFEGNTALNGGAMTLCGSSSFFINANTTIIFKDNHAENTGGAIYIQTSCIGQYEPCFFQPNLDSLTLISSLNTTYNLSLIFTNNSAGIAGSSIYGGNIERCHTYHIFSYDNISKGFNYSLNIAEAIFKFDTGSFSDHISSDAYKVILCDNNDSLPYAIPGKRFTVSVRSVGQLNGPSMGVVTGKLSKDSNETRLNPVGYYNPTTKCNDLSMILTSTNTNRNYYSAVLKVQQNKQESIYGPRMNVNLNISVKSCPWGFQLNLKSGICECHSSLVHTHIHCFLDDLIIQKDSFFTWLGCKSGSSCMNGSLLYAHCSQVSYCNKYFNVSANNTHHQCQTGRTGIACGSCSTNFSAVFGSSKCKRCSNSYLSLLSLYLIAPIILLILISKLDITIANGTVYGFLFYVGSIEIYKNLFEYDINGKWYYLALSYVISWLNLNVGREVCFFNGMTTYHKIWLEFVFIFYIWILEAFIVYLCRKYTVFTRMCGNNISKVLSTVLYMTILKTAVLTSKCLLFGRITNINKNSVSIVWSPQTDILYMSAYHVPLFLISIVMFVVIMIFQGSLLCIQFMRRNSRLRLVKRLLPFFETFNGPCNDTHAFWPGLMLFFQGLSHYLIDIFFYPEYLVFLILGFASLLLIVLSFLGPHGVYKKWSLNILELAYMSNFLILTVLIYILYVCGITKSIDDIIFSSIILTFACFILYHFKHKLKLMVSALVNTVMFIILKGQRIISKCRKKKVNPLLDVSSTNCTIKENERSSLLY